MINWKKKKESQKRTIIKLFQQNKIVDSPKTNSKTFSCFAGLLCNNKHFFKKKFFFWLLKCWEIDVWERERERERDCK